MILPNGYEHHICSITEEEANGTDNVSFIAKIRLSAKTEEDIVKWIKDFEKSSQTTWRVSQTYRRTGTKVIFKVSLYYLLFGSLAQFALSILTLIPFMGTYGQLACFVFEKCHCVQEFQKCIVCHILMFRYDLIYMLYIFLFLYNGQLACFVRVERNKYWLLNSLGNFFYWIFIENVLNLVI